MQRDAVGFFAEIFPDRNSDPASFTDLICGKGLAGCHKNPERIPMRIQGNYRLIFVAAALLSAGVRVSSAQATSTSSASQSPESVCKEMVPVSAVHAALQLVCRQQRMASRQSASAQIIVIGFVGGFANPKDEKHPEVLFADYLREHYGSGFHAKVFSNHDAKGALGYISRLLDDNHDGALSAEEKTNARIIVYGHSWGASETARFAWELGSQAIPVLLTIQVDIIPKFRQKPLRIPPNVESAINFYQSEGFLQGRPEIIASDAARTDILGNFRFTYGHRHLNCNNYPWFARTFNRPHHEIENDPHVWDQIASLIAARVSGFASRSGKVDVGSDQIIASSSSYTAPCCSRSITPAP